MKKLKEYWQPFFTKEKFLLIFFIFILMNICIYVAYHGSIYSHKEYIQTYANAGLEFYYSLHCIGVNPFLFMIFMLLIPNLISYDFLNLHQTHEAYLIETRIGKKRYYFQCFIKNILMSIIIIFLLETLLILIIHFCYIPIQFNTMNYPDYYYIKTQLLSQNELLSLTSFMLLTSLGYGLTSALLFPLQIMIPNKYIYRCFGVIFGILLILGPALIQGYLPVPEAAFILQINNIVALGMENVRANPFGLSHLCLYTCCFIIYSLITYLTYQVMLKWRYQYD